MEGWPTVSRRLVLVGGFLGAGKTTLIGNVATEIVRGGGTCGIVTNDQVDGLVDTQLMETVGAAAVAEVAGGCFCCKLEDLVAILRDRWAGGLEAGAADDDGSMIVFAEPVGSCTDLMSTVILPLRDTYGIDFEVSPLSVVVDGRRALASLGGRRTPGDFSKDVGYIYRKQLEEAEIIVVNKADAMAPEDVEDLLERIEGEYPGRETFVMSARNGNGVDAWRERVLGGSAAPQRLMDMDYARYGAGEALLGWFNGELAVDGRGEDGDAWLLGLATRVSEALSEAGCEVAHFKMALRDTAGRLGTVNQTLSGTAPEISRSFGGSLGNGELTVNLRAEADPERLREIVESVLSSETWGTVAAFRPGQPVPTARVTSLAGGTIQRRIAT